MSNVAISVKVVKNKLGLLELARTLGNVSKACKIMGYSREISTPIKNLMKRAGRSLYKTSREGSPV